MGSEISGRIRGNPDHRIEVRDEDGNLTARAFVRSHNRKAKSVLKAWMEHRGEWAEPMWEMIEWNTEQDIAQLRLTGRTVLVIAV